MDNAGTDKLLRASAKVSATEGWVVGQGGVMVHYTGGVWQPISKLVTTDLNGIYALRQ